MRAFFLLKLYMKRIFSTVVCLLLLLSGYAQTKQPFDFNKFTPLKSEGTLPDVVAMSGNDFMSTSQKNTTEVKNRTARKAKDQFVLESSFSIQELFTSGLIVYNGPIGDYLEKIRIEVTKSDPQLAAETKIFVIKSSVVNAFATNQGYIFITTGLLSKVENEAQLAFVLSHELMHYKYKHAYKSYVNDKILDKKKAGLGIAGIDLKYLAKSNYSRDNESEADIKGFELFSKTKYSLSAPKGVFDMLKFSTQPFGNASFDVNAFLGSQYIIFPESYILENVDEPVGEDEDEDDLLSTHPNLKKRRADIAKNVDFFETDDKSQRADYVLSKDDFAEVQNLARFDLCHTYLVNAAYDKALYNAYCLLQTYKDNIYLKKVVLKSLYGIAKFRNVKRDNTFGDYEKTEGPQQRLRYLFKKLKSKDINTIAANYAWRLSQSLEGKDIEVSLISKDLFIDLAALYIPDKNMFFSTPRDLEAEKRGDKPTEVKSVKESESGTPTPLIKSEGESRTKKLKRKEHADNEEEGGVYNDGGEQPMVNQSFILYAFVDLLKDTTFANFYTRNAKSIEVKARKMASRNTDDFDSDLPEEVSSPKEQEGMVYNAYTNTYALGVDSVLLLNPIYLQVDERKDIPVMYVSSSNAQEVFNKNIAKLSKRIGLKTELINNKDFSTSSVDAYNDMCVLLTWLNECDKHEDIEMLPVDYIQVQEIRNKYNIDHLALMGTVSVVTKKENVGFLIYAAVIFPVYSWAFALPAIFKRDITTTVFTKVLNLKTGKVEMVQRTKCDLSDKNDVIDSILYDHLFQIKRAGKNK